MHTIFNFLMPDLGCGRRRSCGIGRCFFVPGGVVGLRTDTGFNLADADFSVSVLLFEVRMSNSDL